MGDSTKALDAVDSPVWVADRIHRISNILGEMAIFAKVRLGE